MNINMTNEALEAHETFMNNPNEDTYNAFKDAFIQANSEDMWKVCIEFWCHLGSADLYDYCHEETID